MNNPLVAERQDSTKDYTGIGPIEAAEDLRQAFANGTWVDQGLALAGGGLEALSFVLDPFGSLIAAAVSWIIEHIGPLRQALNWLAGDADQIAAYAQTWNNVSQAVSRANETLVAEVNRGAAGWTGASADAYRASIAGQSRHIAAAASCSGTIGLVVEVSGVLVGTVRGLVRDLIAECVATLVARIPLWLAEEAVTLGFATPHVVASAVAIIAKWVAKIADKVTLLLRSIARLRPLLSRLDEVWELIKRGLKALRKAPDGPGAPKPPDPVKKPGNTDVKPKGGDTGDTSTSGTQGGNNPPVSRPPETHGGDTGGNTNTSGTGTNGGNPPVSKPPQTHGGDTGGTGGNTNTSGTTGGTVDTPPKPQGGDTHTSGSGTGTTNPPTDGSGGGSNKPPGDTNPPPTPGDPDPHPLGRRPTDLTQPHPELTKAEKAALDKHLKELEAKNAERFQDTARDPDHKGKVRPGSKDEARVAFDLEERGYGPFERPKDAAGNLQSGRGDWVDSSGQHWDMKGINSDWPPDVPDHVRNSRPYTDAYNEQWFRETVQGQFGKGRNVILDTRNASAADIANVKAIVDKEGWGARVIFYP
ncbi:hypothetical protein FHS29_004280 [Saccharothrix tamanrassetensis]|uniref:Uncharacterized protein n=1 Tax=Saccharothrix tamanrassetensis TaxID=1051531 RepID=A0A841CNW7_9PSEU|nr:hypothetical protein [Saccharothrix tamanrassetensis]MBB5957685.1 hypothetical protein [Saccharothrix tamanrassetensis]